MPNDSRPVGHRKSKDNHALRAAEVWPTLDENERVGIRYGMFPRHVMVTLEKEGFNDREMCLALMDVASRNGGMRA